MPIEFAVATPVALPAQSGITHAYATMHLADAFAIGLPPGASRDPEVLARFIVAHQPSWIGTLTHIRDLIVARFGLKTARQLATLAGDTRARRIGIFKIYSAGDTEIVLGEDDKHLDFRVSLLCFGAATPESGAELTVSTVVHCHNALGRAYIAVIAPFHRRVILASLRRAAAIGWPHATVHHGAAGEVRQ